MSLLEDINRLLGKLNVPIETGIFSDKAPEQYIILVPLVSTFELFSDNQPNKDIEEIRISIFSKSNYINLKNKIQKTLLKNDFTITERRYNGYEKETKYHHYTIDVAKDYDIEEE